MGIKGYVSFVFFNNSAWEPEAILGFTLKNPKTI